jgi:protoporphyrin/coproporphyrin ferrochelatase
MKKGVLLMAYGSPDKTEDIEPYYTDIRRGMRPSPAQLEELTGRYNAIGGSPLLKITSEQAMSLQNELGNDYQVFMGMRHWKPWIMDAVEKMRQQGICEAVGIVMAPHYSSMSIEKYIDKVEEAKKQLNYPLEVKYIKSWHNHPLFIEALHHKIENALNQFSNEERKNLYVIFTAHSLPEKILENNDPYKDQLIETCELLAKKDHFKNWTFAFQSAGRTQEKWLGPDLLHVIDDLNDKGVKSILVCSVGFITDHLEVLYDIDIEGKNHAKKLGIHLERTESLNADVLLARLLAGLTKDKLI